MVSNTQPDLQGQQKRDPKKTLATLAPEVLQAPLASPGPQIPMIIQGDDCWHSSAMHGHKPVPQSNTEPATDDNKDKVTLQSRRFITEDEYPPQFSLKDIEVEIGTWMCVACPASTKTCPTCKQLEGHDDALLLAIHGACITRNNVTRSSFGLYYGANNFKNISHAITGKAHTNQVAVLTACLRALRNATSIMDERLKLSRMGISVMPLRTFIIKTDSEYLVRGITEWLPKWKKAGWKTCKGVTVANANLFKLVEAGITVLERIVEVKLWLVPKENNKEAEFLAKAALMHGGHGYGIAQV